jgi:hypothetical protein
VPDDFNAAVSERGVVLGVSRRSSDFRQQR